MDVSTVQLLQSVRRSWIWKKTLWGSDDVRGCNVGGGSWFLLSESWLEIIYLPKRRCVKKSDLTKATAHMHHLLPSLHFLDSLSNSFVIIISEPNSCRRPADWDFSDHILNNQLWTPECCRTLSMETSVINVVRGSTDPQLQAPPEPPRTVRKRGARVPQSVERRGPDVFVKWKQEVLRWFLALSPSAGWRANTQQPPLCFREEKVQRSSC